MEPGRRPSRGQGPVDYRAMAEGNENDTPQIHMGQPSKCSVATKRSRISGHSQASAPPVMGEQDPNRGEPDLQVLSSRPKNAGGRSNPPDSAQVSSLRRATESGSRGPMDQEEALPPKQEQDSAPAPTAPQPPPRPQTNNSKAVANGGVVLGEVRRVGDAGHIKKIRLENFMCHGNFEIDFGTHVTLVSGANGSGKSAIMQALQICLGCSAKETGRAKSFVEFIKTGEPEAKILVTLYNTGSEAYMPASYGSVITIERRLTRNSCNPFKLLDQMGKMVTNKREDVTLMLDHFSINASNPLSIITQDMARSFLSGDKNKKRKYELFYEGTMLDAIKEDHRSSDVKNREELESLKICKKKLKDKADEVKLCNDKLAKLCDADKLTEQGDALERTWVWRTVYKDDHTIKKLKDLVIRAPDIIEAHEKIIEECTSELEELKVEEHKKVEEIREYQRMQENDQAEKSRLNSAVVNAKRVTKAIERNIESQKANLAHMMEQKQTFTKVLEEDTDQKAEERRAALEEFERKMAAKVEVISDLERQHAEIRAEVIKLRDMQDALKQEEVKANRDIRGCHQQLGSFYNDRQALAKSEENTVFNFGKEPVLRLVNLINENLRMFTKKPVGPVGAHLGLKDPKWGKAVEVGLSSSLEIFLVHCAKDGEVLRRMSQQVNMDSRKFTMLQSNFDIPLHVIPPHRRAPPNLTTVMDVISVTGDELAKKVITNALIDRNKIESTILVECSRQARDMVYTGQVKGSIIDIVGTSYQRRGSSTSITSSNLIPRLGMSTQQQLEQVNEGIQKFESDMARFRQHAEGLTKTLYDTTEQLSQLQRKETMLVKEKKLAQVAIRQIEKNIGPAAGGEDDANDSDLVMTQIQQCNVDISSTQVEVSEQEIQLGEAVQQLEAAEATLEEYRRHINGKLEGAGRYEEEVVAIGAKLKEARNKQQHCMGELSNKRAVFTDAEASIARLEAGRSSLKEVASQTCSEEESITAAQYVQEYHDQLLREAWEKKRRQPGNEAISDEQMEEHIMQRKEEMMQPAALESELGKVRKKISNVEREAGGDREDLEAQLKILLKDEVLYRGLFTKRKEDYQRVETGLHMRNRSYNDLRTSILRASDAKFRKHLARRGHTGRLLVNEVSKELILEVQIKGLTDPEAPVVTDLKQLSGGERSLTTVAFLLALGQWTENPFRCMDEFDVFMDAINRRVATETLLEFAYTNSERQFIFLTPQDIQTVEDAKLNLGKRFDRDIPNGFVKIVVMKAVRQE